MTTTSPTGNLTGAPRTDAPGPPAGTTAGVVLLGSTGSIGTQALDVVTHVNAVCSHGPQTAPPLRVLGLAAGGGHLDLLAEQAVTHGVPIVAVADGDPSARRRLAAALAGTAARLGLPNPVRTVLTGPDAATDLVAATGAGSDDVVLNGITGSVGLRPTLAALASGATLALANKESLVVGGAVVRAAMRRPGQVVPVDSEHSALAQALRSGCHEKGLTSPVLTGRSEVRRLVLTASGGPFRGRSRASLAGVTAEQALAHPTWAMGPVVTVNSSTMVNKGLELIEAHLLFDVCPECIDVVVHPQSVIHSMVEFTDGATLAQASPPDMRLPIALGLTWPERADLTATPDAPSALPTTGPDGGGAVARPASSAPAGLVTPCDWTVPTSWTFEPLDEETFPAVALARHAVATSPTHPAVLNAANEQAVAAFLAGRLEWLDIVEVDGAVVEEHAGTGSAEPTLDDVLGAESWARARADEIIAARSRA